MFLHKLLLSFCAVTALGAAPRLLDDVPPAIPEVWPVGGVRLLHAQPFTVQTPWAHEWRADGAPVHGGVLLVLEVDKALVWPRQFAEPVLFVGAQTAERINVGHESGRVIALVPAAVDGRGRVALDLSATPIFFGAPQLPEQVDAAIIARTVAAARQAAIAPAGTAELQAAIRPQVAFAGRDDVRLYASDLIEHHSPQEVDLVSGLRAPRLVTK